MTEAPATGSPCADEELRLIHQSLIYGTDEDFLSATVPFCLDGLEQDDAVLAVTTPHNIDLLRQALGDADSQVEFVAADDWYLAPGSTLGAYYRYVDERTASGRYRQVRVIGEPVWHGRDAVETGEWTRYESVINIAFASCPAWIVCPYDIRVLPEQVVADAQRTHPQLLIGRDAQRSDNYAHPAESGLWERELVPGPADGVQAVMSFGGDLSPVRAFVTDTALSLGLTTTEAQRLTFAVNELATNAVHHGGGSGKMTIWRAGQRVICDVTDNGSTGTNWYIGYLPPSPDATSGHGLWTVRQLCDLLEVHTAPGATTVRVHIRTT